MAWLIRRVLKSGVSGTGATNLTSVSDAAAAIDAAAVTPRVEAVALDEATGRRLAEDVVSDGDYPPFDKALMDGYAVAVGEAAGEFEVVGDVPAGAAVGGAGRCRAGASFRS